MADANAGGEQPTTEQLVHQLGTISRRLPTFWAADPELWFAQVEQEFARRNITAQMTKFREVVTSLSSAEAMEVRDIVISPPDQEPYEHLKRELIRRTTASEQRRLQQLITAEELGDRKPSQLLRRMTHLLGSQASLRYSSLLRELFLQRLPSDVRRILATSSNIPLDDLAELADKILDTAPPMIQATTYPTSGHPLPATEASSFDFQRLHDDVAHLINERDNPQVAPDENLSRTYSAGSPAAVVVPRNPLPVGQLVPGSTDPAARERSPAQLRSQVWRRPRGAGRRVLSTTAQTAGRRS
ncbi:uncharacterized protein ISCGN_010285 [Ixodes scapularis]